MSGSVNMNAALKVAQPHTARPPTGTLSRRLCIVLRPSAAALISMLSTGLAEYMGPKVVSLPSVLSVPV